MKTLSSYKMTEADGIGLYVGTYGKYNSGSLFGMWIDLESVSDAEEFFEVCRSLHSDEADPEFMMQDFQGFPEAFYHESMSEDDVQKVLEYIALDDDDREMLEDFCECYGYDVTDEDLVEEARGRSMGCYESFRDFADQLADEELACTNAPDFCTRYFDYEAFARDLKFDFSIGSNGYVFSDNG